MKFCPKCYSSVPNGKTECPHCGFKMVSIDPKPQQAARPEREKPKAPPPKKKAKKSDVMILVGVLAAFVIFMVLATAPKPSLPKPSVGGGSGRVAGSSQSGSGGQASSGGAAKATAKPTATSGTVGMPYKVQADGEVYFSFSKEAMEAVAKKEDVQPLLEDKELLLIENGTRVTLVSVSGELAFVDILEGEYEGSVGYILHAALKPAG